MQWPKVRAETSSVEPTKLTDRRSAAIVHYRARHGTSTVIDPNEIYLCDSGGHYHDGTTDATRTMHFGIPKENEKQAYTLVLKGLIALHQAVFPRGVAGGALNVFSRQFLWVGSPKISNSLFSYLIG